ncbi:hypothetical protein EJ02DRAFT_362143, partial [Clathrospora elynae]
GVGGHSGLLVRIGLEMSRLSMDAARGPLFPLIDSVSLDHEKERLGLVFVTGVFFSGEHGGVTSPMGMR